MKTELFISLIKEAKNLSSMYTLADILNDKCETLDIRGVAHKGFFASITDFPSYYAANMALLNYKSAQELSMITGQSIHVPMIPARLSISILQM